MKHFQTDDGKKWFNSKLKSLLTKFNINHYSTYSGKNASIVERFNKTLKTDMWRKFTEQGDYRWVKILNGLIDKYNYRVHRTTGYKPKDVSYKNEREVFLNISKAVKSRRRHTAAKKCYVGDQVMVSKYKKTFAKGYLPNWTNEVFTICKVKSTRPLTYVLKDVKGAVIREDFMLKKNQVFMP